MASIIGAGSGGTAFANATVGDPVSVVVDVEIAQQTFGGAVFFFQVNWTTSSVTIGNAVDDDLTQLTL
ncbi:MAG: hypothetical protein AAGG01_08035, partial [Planctomycetota bacterium]